MKIFHLGRQRELVPTHVIHLKLASFCNLYLTTTQLPSVSTTLLSSYKSAVIPSVRPLRSTRGTPSPPPTPVPMPQLLTRPPKGRKAYLWPVAWWAPTAVCSGIRPCERGGGIPATAAFVTGDPLFAFYKTAVQSPLDPAHGVKGTHSREDFRLLLLLALDVLWQLLYLSSPPVFAPRLSVHRLFLHLSIYPCFHPAVHPTIRVCVYVYFVIFLWIPWCKNDI